MSDTDFVCGLSREGTLEAHHHDAARVGEFIKVIRKNIDTVVLELSTRAAMDDLGTLERVLAEYISTNKPYTVWCQLLRAKIEVETQLRLEKNAQRRAFDEGWRKGQEALTRKLGISTAAVNPPAWTE